MSKKVLEINYLHQLCEQIKAEVVPSKIHDQFSNLLEFYDIINYSFSYSREIWRGRLCEN